MSRLWFGGCRIALAATLMASALSLAGCAKRFGGSWPWGEDQSADLAKYGPVAVQRIEQMQKQATKVRRGTKEEKEVFAAELSRKMPNETDPVVRMAIVDILKKIDAPSAGAVLYAGLKDPEPDVRIACCQAWGDRPSEEATRILSESLSSDTDRQVRLAAVKALSSAKDSDAVRALGLALEDPDPALQYRAVASLRSVTGKDLGNDVGVWREYAQHGQIPERPQSIAQRLREMF